MKVYTNSALKTYRLCPRKYYYAYECRIEMIDPSSRIAMDKGTEIHRSIQGKLAGLTIEELDIDLVTYPEILVLFQYYETDGIDLIEGEKQLHMVIPNQNVILAGKLDGIVKTSNDEINLLEIKTSRFKLTEDEDVLAKWDIDRQLGMYSLLARSNGIEHTGIIVDYLRTPSLKRKKDESDEEFLQRINENVAKNLDTYYGKISIQRTVEQDEECLEETLQEIRMIKSCMSHGIWTRTGEACNEYHKLCPFTSLCRCETDVSQYTKREHQHPELDASLFPEIAPIF